MTPRERIEALLDPDAPFLELSPLAAWGTDFTVGAMPRRRHRRGQRSRMHAGCQRPDRSRAGTSNPWTLRKILRANQIAIENRLPVISLVESGGADLPTQKEIFIPGGQMFRDLTRLSAARHPDYRAGVRKLHSRRRLHPRQCPGPRRDDQGTLEGFRPDRRW